MSDGAAHPCGDDAVLVVVDLQSLEPAADPVAACAPHAPRLDGVEILESAGFSATGSARFGRAFTCRIDDRPSATERLAIPGRGTHRETCADTPPPTAYWSYWTADPGSCDWTYSTVGATSTTATAGSAQGWSFALDAAPGAAPKPRVGPCDEDAALRETVAVSSVSSDASSGTGAGPEASGRLDPFVALALLAGVVLLAATTAWRRRRRRALLDVDSIGDRHA